MNKSRISAKFSKSTSHRMRWAACKMIRECNFVTSLSFIASQSQVGCASITHSAGSFISFMDRNALKMPKTIESSSINGISMRQFASINVHTLPSSPTCKRTVHWVSKSFQSTYIHVLVMIDELFCKCLRDTCSHHIVRESLLKCRMPKMSKTNFRIFFSKLSDDTSYWNGSMLLFLWASKSQKIIITIRSSLPPYQFILQIGKAMASLQQLIFQICPSKQQNEAKFVLSIEQRAHGPSNGGAYSAFLCDSPCSNCMSKYRHNLDCERMDK